LSLSTEVLWKLKLKLAPKMSHNVTDSRRKSR
jgi:hypothetical protein